MSKPIPSSDQLVALNVEIAGNNAQISAFLDSVSLQEPIILQKQKVDDAFKDLFAYYNDNVIGKYDIERKAINGTFVPSPVVEADIIGVSSNPPTGRLVPTPPVFDIVRIPEFDAGGYTGLASNYEQKHITDQASVENVLVSGYGPGTHPMTLETFTALTPSSTTLSLEDASVAISGIVANTVFLVIGTGDLAVVKVISTSVPVGTPPPYKLDLVIELIVPPTGTIPAGANLDSFTGFTNTERTTKIASDPDLQPLMNYLVAQLQARINDRISRLNEQLPALATNEDADGAANITTATNNVNTSKNFLTNYLITTDISNTGLSSLSTERATRSGQLTTRLSQIMAAYTGQTENYYEQRYQTANNRGNTQRGTLRAVENAKSVKTTLQNLAAGLAGANAALGSIIP